MVTKQNKTSRTIVEKLRLQSDKVISKEEIFHIISEYQRIYRKKVNIGSIWTYIRKSRYVRRILGDYYYIYSLEERHNRYCCYAEEELIFLVLGKMKLKWYLGLERALQEHGLSWQVLRITPIINTHFSGIKTLGSSQFRFIKTKEKRFRAGIIEKKTNNKVQYYYSDLEKTYLDFLYFYSYQGKDIKAVQKQLGFKMKRAVVKSYAQHYSKKIQRAL